MIKGYYVDEIIEEAIRLRTLGQHGLCLNLLRNNSNDKKNTRLVIQTIMSYLAANLVDHAIKELDKLDKKTCPIYLLETLFISLYKNKNKKFISDIFSDMENSKHLSKLTTFFTTFDIDYFTLTYIIRIIKEQDENSKRRLNFFLLDISNKSIVKYLYKNKLSRTKKIEILKIFIFQDYSYKKVVLDKDIEYFLNIKSLISEDSYFTKISESILEYSKILIEFKNIQYNDTLYKIIVFFQSYKPESIKEQLIKDISLSCIFPSIISKSSALNKIRYGNFYYRYYHSVAQIVGDDIEYLIEEDYYVNDFWHGFTFVKGSVEFFKNNFRATDYFYNLTEKFILDLNLNKNELASLGHVTSALCWNTDARENTFKIIPNTKLLYKIPSNLESKIIYILGADIVYTNSFLELFVEMNSIMNESKDLSTIYINIFINYDSIIKFKEEFETIKKEYSNKYKKDIYFNFVISDKIENEFALEKGSYTLLRYYNIIELMISNPIVEYFVISDIDGHCQFSDNINLEIFNNFDVILGAITDKDSYGIPSYVGAGCLVVKNNEKGKFFIKNLMKSISYFNNKNALNKWNLDQASIRYAIMKSVKTEFGYFPLIGNILRFANAYNNKNEYIEKTKQMYSIEFE